MKTRKLYERYAVSELDDVWKRIVETVAAMTANRQGAADIHSTEEGSRPCATVAVEEVTSQLTTEQLLLLALAVPQLAERTPNEFESNEHWCVATALLRANLTHWLGEQLAGKSRVGERIPLLPAEQQRSEVPTEDSVLMQHHLLEQVNVAFDIWIAEALQKESSPPDEYDALSDLKELVDDLMPHDDDISALVRIALQWRVVNVQQGERHTSYPLAEFLPPSYETLLSSHKVGTELMTAASLIWENLYLSLVDHIEQCWFVWRSSYFASRPGPCAFCHNEESPQEDREFLASARPLAVLQQHEAPSAFVTQQTRYVGEFSVSDPDTGSPVTLIVYKAPGGGMFAVDASYLEQVRSVIASPFDDGVRLDLSAGDKDC